MIKIVHARSSENKTRFGEAGDQTGHEVEVSNYYEGKNLAVYRAKSAAVAEQIVSFMERAASNSNIGYSQGKARYTLYDACGAVEFKPEKITQPVNCDCSSLVAAACVSAGLDVPKTMTTNTQDKALTKTGAFDVLHGASVKLQRGDIVRRTGHTFVVVSGDQERKKIDYAQKKDVKKYGKKYTPRGGAFVRAGASIHKEIIDTVYNGTVLNCYGYYSTDNRPVDWLLVEYVVKGETRTGFVSTKAVVLK